MYVTEMFSVFVLVVVAERELRANVGGNRLRSSLDGSEDGASGGRTPVEVKYRSRGLVRKAYRWFWAGTGADGVTGVDVVVDGSEG